MIGRMAEPEPYAIAIVGGAVSAAEVAGMLSDVGVLTVVLEQNPRPYGKIEDGLPRWHRALREKEYRTIDEKLERPHVHFVPCTRLGRDVQLSELINEWGLHAVILAHGAWADRSFPVEGADSFVGRGLVYQNPFIHWFNHYVEQGYKGEQYEILDGTIVVGGGLASIDVVKVLQLELVLRALRERGIEEDLVETEVKGIPEVLKRHNLTWDALGLEGSTIYYRRRPEDMPLVDVPEGANEKTVEKIEKSRGRVLEKAMRKYLFRVESLHAPEVVLVEGERMTGVRFARTRIEAGRAVKTEETVDVHAPMVISSIGSVPEPLQGIDMKGELYDYSDWEFGCFRDYPNLFSCGNVVTGKGNIVASRKHGNRVARHVIDDFLHLGDAATGPTPLTPEQREKILDRVRALQSRAGCDGDYRAWIERMTPPDLQ
jgi:NADPH-dependent glutamate synthase beta subunit-like oxidoreductase